MNERQYGLAMLISESAKKYPTIIQKLPKLNWEDRGTDDPTFFSMCYDSTKPHLKNSCGPDWVFYHWPSASITSFEETKNKIIEASNLKPLISKVGWYGNLSSPLSDVPEYKTRPLLKSIADKNQHCIDVIHVPPNRGKIDSTVEHYMSLEDLVKQYAYLLDIGGNGYSGRLKFLLFSKRPLLIVERRYIEYFYNDLKPYVHFIPVKLDLSDLIKKIDWIIKNPEAADAIAQNAFNFAMENFSKNKLMKRICSVYEHLQTIEE